MVDFNVGLDCLHHINHAAEDGEICERDIEGDVFDAADAVWLYCNDVGAYLALCEDRATVIDCNHRLAERYACVGRVYELHVNLYDEICAGQLDARRLDVEVEVGDKGVGFRTGGRYLVDEVTASEDASANQYFFQYSHIVFGKNCPAQSSEPDRKT